MRSEPRAETGTAPTAAGDPASETMVEVIGVSKRFGDVAAVDDVSFSIRKGDFLTILGPSGSGKSTLLRMIAGFMPPTAGDIVIHGRNVESLPAYRRSIGMVFQRLALFPHMTAAENVAYPLKMRRFAKSGIRDRVAHYLCLVRLDGYADRRIHELSGGQQQRVAIARALVFQPDLLLLDEPLAALDKKLREDMQLEFRRIQQDLGVTTINVTHDQREALVMSDRIIVMDEGRIQQTADPLATYNMPANAFVAGFLGMTNLLPGALLARDGERITARIGSVTFPGIVPTGAVTGLGTGTGLACALRAERIRIAGRAAAVPPGMTAVDAVIVEEIFEGDRLIYVCRAPAFDDALLRVVDSDIASHGMRRVDEAVRLVWQDRDMMIFPP